MTKRAFVFPAAVLVLLTITWIITQKEIVPTEPLFHISVGNAKLDVEIAESQGTREQGLGGRKSLQEGRGMLFIFEEPDFYPFWMRGMKFSLDIIWFDENRKVVDYMKNAPPDSYPTAFKPESRAKYVLETNSGWADANNIKIGDALIIR